ncbi:MAG: NAD-dependent deacylase [Chloroflexi bacterium]|nr:NAD-dependent deacylase [Chloroflexota bacterium]
MPALSPRSQEGIRCAADILRASKRAVALTGAGISTPSGIPDFRSPDSGLWSQHDPFETASLTAFRHRPQRFFDWMLPLARTIQNAQPNPAHYGLARLEAAGLLQGVITQNIDGLHQRSGSSNVLEVHGTLETLTCAHCFRPSSAADYRAEYLETGVAPRCARCGGVLKPDIILFGEQLPARTWLKAQTLARQCDLFIVAGSSLEVLPVAGLPMRALENGAHLIIINRSATYLDVRADVTFPDDVLEIIPQIVAEVLGD